MIPAAVKNADRLREDLNKVDANLAATKDVAGKTTAAAETATASADKAAGAVSQLDARGIGADVPEIRALYLIIKAAAEQIRLALSNAKVTEQLLDAARAELARVQAHEREQDKQISLLEAQRDDLLKRLETANAAIDKLEDAEKKAQASAMVRLIVWGCIIGVAGGVLAFTLPAGRTVGLIIALVGGGMVVAAIFVSWLLSHEWLILIAVGGVAVFVLYKLGVISWAFKRTVAAVEHAEPGKAKAKVDGVKAALSSTLGAAAGLFTREVDAAKKSLGLTVKKTEAPKP